MDRVAVGLGSNLGDRNAHLEAGIGGLATVGTRIRRSSIYETAPIGGPDQGSYLNAVALLDTELEPRSLLERMLAIEHSRGRVRRTRWGPRTLDLDLLLIGSRTLDEPGLRVPHPRLTERRFVLEPLLEVWPDARLPDGTHLAPLLDGLGDQVVSRIDGANPAAS